MCFWGVGRERLVYRLTAGPGWAHTPQLLEKSPVFKITLFDYFSLSASLLLQAPPGALRTPPAKPEISIHDTVRGDPARVGRAASGDSREGCSRARGRTCVCPALHPATRPVSWLQSDTSLLNDIILNISLQRMSKHHPTRGSGQQTPVLSCPAFFCQK